MPVAGRPAPGEGPAAAAGQARVSLQEVLCRVIQRAVFVGARSAGPAHLRARESNAGSVVRSFRFCQSLVSPAPGEGSAAAAGQARVSLQEVLCRVIQRAVFAGARSAGPAHLRARKSGVGPVSLGFRFCRWLVVRLPARVPQLRRVRLGWIFREPFPALPGQLHLSESVARGYPCRRLVSAGFDRRGFLRGAFSWPGLWLASEGWLLARLSRGASLRLAMDTETSRATMPASPRRRTRRQAKSPGELFAVGLVYGDSRLAAYSYLQERAGRPL